MTQVYRIGKAAIKGALRSGSKLHTLSNLVEVARLSVQVYEVVRHATQKPLCDEAHCQD